MNPLTVTWPPAIYTDYGYRNFINWINVGGLIISHIDQMERFKRLTKLSIQNILHPFQTFILGQKNLAQNLRKNLELI